MGAYLEMKDALFFHPNKFGGIRSASEGRGGDDRAVSYR